MAGRGGGGRRSVLSFIPGQLACMHKAQRPNRDIVEHAVNFETPDDRLRAIFCQQCTRLSTAILRSFSAHPFPGIASLNVNSIHSSYVKPVTPMGIAQSNVTPIQATFFLEVLTH